MKRVCYPVPILVPLPESGSIPVLNVSFCFFQDAKLDLRRADGKGGMNEMGYWLNEVMAVTGYNCRI